MLESIIEFISGFFIEVFLESALGMIFSKFVDFIFNKVKSKPIRIIIYIFSLIFCIAIIFAIIYGILLLISTISK